MQPPVCVNACGVVCVSWIWVGCPWGWCCVLVLPPTPYSVYGVGGRTNTHHHPHGHPTQIQLTHTTPHALTHTGGCIYSFVYFSWRWTRTVSETCRGIINQVNQKLHLVGSLLTRVNETWLSLQIFEKYANNEYYEILSSNSRFVPCAQMDRRTDMTKLIVVFRNSASEPKKAFLSTSKRNLYTFYLATSNRISPNILHYKHTHKVYNTILLQQTNDVGSTRRSG